MMGVGVFEFVSVPLATSASNTTAAQGNAYAAHVLGQALLPPEAQVTTTVVTSILTVEQTPAEFPLGNHYDAHALYLDSLPPNQVATFIESHVPKNTWITGNGPPPAGVTQIQVRLPVSGPNDEDAQDIYTIVADTTGLPNSRVDAQVVWNPSRPKTEVAPSSGSVEVTGYTHGNLMEGAFDPVAVRVTGAQAKRIRRAFNGLALASSPGGCMEAISGFKIAFVPEHKSSPHPHRHNSRVRRDGRREHAPRCA